MTHDEIQALPALVDLPTAATVLGIGRGLAYEMVRRGEWPTPLLRMGRLIKVPTAPLVQLLHPEPPLASADPSRAAHGASALLPVAPVRDEAEAAVARTQATTIAAATLSDPLPATTRPESDPEEIRLTGLPTRGDGATPTATETQPRLLLSVEQVAQRLGLGTSTVRGLIADEQLESVVIGRLRRIPAVAVDDYIASLRRGA